ncbi:MAG TPA: PEPxxWA-CTERM sorting domain-containing protein [Caulobacteraceae bacterium]|jgi:hypothetical protein
MTRNFLTAAKLLIGGAAAAMAVAAGAAQATVVVNGDFSQPQAFPNSGQWSPFNGVGGVPGWTDLTDQIEIGNNGTYGLKCFSATICQNLEVNANNFDTVTQTFTDLDTNKTYTVSWAYAGRNGGGPQTLNVSFAGQTVTNSSDGLADDAVWNMYSITVKPTSSTETLTFASENTAGQGGLPSYGGEITDVAIAVPEPATWATMMLGLGCIGAGLRMSRRRDVAAPTAA